MAQTIKLKRGTTTPTTSNIVSGEVAIDTSAQKLYINDSGTIKEIGGGGGLANVVEDTSPQLGGALDTNGNNIDFPDSTGQGVNRLAFGDADDMQMYHNGTDSWIYNLTGNLTLGSNNILLRSVTGAETYASMTVNGAVNLYYDNAAKFATTSTGVDVTGTAVVDGLTIGTMTYPTADGTDGQVLTTDGAGNLAFETVSGGGGGVSQATATAISLIFG
jgi:hypothetical protein